MNNTIGDSKRNRTTAVAATSVIVKDNEKELYIPPKGKVYEAIAAYVEENGNIEIPAGYGRLNVNGILELESGKKLSMKNEESSYRTVKNSLLKRNARGKATSEVREIR